MKRHDSLGLVGYADPLVVRQGDEVAFMVSCEARSYRVQIVRLLHGDTNPRGPGLKFLTVPSDVAGEYAGSIQRLVTGSCVVVEDEKGVTDSGGFTLQTWVCPTLLDRDRQVIFARTTRSGDGWAVALERGAISVGFRSDWQGGRATRFPVTLTEWDWFFLTVVHDPSGNRFGCWLLPANGHVDGDSLWKVRDDARPRSGVGAAVIHIAAEPARGPDARVESCLNGKIEGPRLYNRVLSDAEVCGLAKGAPPQSFPGLVAHWDFAVQAGPRTVVDHGPFGLHGQTVNMPTRAVTSHTWDGTVMRWADAPGDYGAIHFHEDDLDDAGWQPSFAWSVPRALPSGIYAAHLATHEGHEDCVPFIVTPRSRGDADVAVLLPVFSYLAYANEHMAEQGDIRARLEAAGIPTGALQPADAYIAANHLHSTYDTHSDGSGVCYSSWRRPLLSLRPTYRARGVGHNGAAHQLAADLYLVDWLYEQGTGVEFVTDVELHTEGAESLRPYRVVISGSHPEYTSRPMVEGLRDYLGSGGRFMYLGGNGSYWVTDFDAERGHTVEVRRWGPATRTWDARPGEWYLSFNGELGGLWRHRGLPSQRWLGVGTTAAGCGETRPYTRTQRSYEPDVSWVFDGVASPHVGDDVECLTYPGGAAGFEMDRFDPALGSPRTTILLASATGFEPSYHKLIDDILNISAAVLEDPDQRYVRADMVLVPYPNGGCVFSVGAITWTACLSSNNYKNSVSVVTNNVVDALRALEGELDGTA